MNRNIRDYEVSVWTLQDSFITVLKHSDIDNKGRIEEPDFDLKNDGTLTFKFSIPMYLKENNVKVENPIWYNTTNGNIIADLRKIKVIFHKNTAYEHIFELLITKVTESHEGFQLTCDVECESLAFHELGKSGYKLSLNQDTFIDYWTKWANGEITGNEPKSNIKFWSDRVIEGTDWECEVQMDWSGYDTSRASNIIYEDAYAAAWDISNEDKFIPTTVVQSKEKERLIDVEESNRYNITQIIAETFGVHCRYEYEHDSDYHITARKIIFYNAFVQEALGPIDINYAYDTTDISREMDSKDTITKMYVKTLTDSNTESGLATIADTAANKSQEDYLLNFDYLYSIGTISQEQYDAVEPYEIEMHRLNEELKGYERQISALENQKIDAAAAEAVAKNAISLDNERISANNALLNSITNNTGFVEVDSARPDSCAAIQTGSTYYINIRQKGIDPSTLHLYTEFTPGAALDSTKEIKTYILENDEFGNLIKVKNIVVNFPSQSKIIYVTYKYSPRLYYENILKTWERRLIKDTDDYTYYHDKVEDIDNELVDLKEHYKSTLNIKEEVIQRFERLMGPAIREGYWQPEDEYAKYGEKHKEDNLNLSNISSFNNSNLASIGWDSELFDEEEKNYFDIAVTQEPQYYHCIDLRGHLSDFTDWADNLSQISFIYRNTALLNGASEDDVRYLSILPFGSQALLRFLQPKSGGEIIPVLMLVGLNVNNYFESVHNPRIGILTTEIQDSQIVTKVEEIISNIDIRLISNPENYNIVYPRIKINSSFLKNTEDSLVLKNNNVVINNYEDYYVLNRLENDSDLKYFITIKPELIFKHGEYGTYTCLYELSNAGLFMYLDALQVLKENAYPRVSYEIKPTFVNDEFIRYAYKYLNYIVHINDPELKFEYVKGYITELHLKLDSPKDDTITIDNYKTKFEDLFSTIVVQTEEMKKNSTLIGMAAQAFTPTGGLQADLVQTVMDRADLNYAFNNGTLTINEQDGIWGTSDSGVVAFRGGGIFTATEKDDNDEWIWNTGILPSGINASLITTGQLDTNLIRIFAGDDLKLQMNGEGLFAYRSQWSNNNGTIAADATRADGLDLGQYVVHNGDGLFLTAEAGTIIGEDENHNPIALENKVNRVSITWDGLTLRNWNNNPTLWADADTGNLTVEGTIRAKELLIIDEDSGSNTTDIDTYINGKIADNPSDFLTANSETITNLDNSVNQLQNREVLNITVEYSITDSLDALPINWNPSLENLTSTSIIWARIKTTIAGEGDVYIPNTKGECIFIPYTKNNILYYCKAITPLYARWSYYLDVTKELIENNWETIQITYPYVTNWQLTLPNPIWIQWYYIWVLFKIDITSDGETIAEISYTNPVVTSTPNSAQTGINDVKDGIDGINFIIPSTNNNATVQINRDVGIKVTDNNQNYFQTTATQMGFFDSNGIKMGYNGQNFLVKGTIYADGGKIGYSESDSNAGWTIGTNSLYSGSASSFDADNGIYLGTGGLSVSGNNYKAHFNTSEFLVNVGDENAAIRIDGDGAVMENLTVTGKFIANNNIEYTGSTVFRVGNGINSNFENLQEVFDILKNKIITQNIIINLTSNIYGYFTLDGVNGNGNISIQSSDPASPFILYGGLWLNNCQLDVVLSEVKVIYGGENNQYPIRIDHSNIISLHNIKIDGGANNICILITNSLVQLNNCVLYNSDVLIDISRNSFLQCKNLDGESNNGRYLDCSYSAIVWSGTRPQGTFVEIDPCLIKCETNNGYSDDLDNLPTTEIPTPQPIPTIITTTNFYPLTEGGTGCFGNSDWNNGANPRQGAYGSILYKGCIWFNLKALAGKTLLSASLTLTRISGAGGSSPVDVYLNITPATSTSSENPVTNSTDFGNIGNIGNGETKTFTIPTTAVSDLFDSSGDRIGGLMLYVNESSDSRKYSSNYAKFDTNIILTVTYQ